MVRHVDSWMALLGWLSLMAIVWALFVPKGLSVGTFTLFSVTGPVLLAAGSVLWRVHQPSSSVRQMRAARTSDR